MTENTKTTITATLRDLTVEGLPKTAASIDVYFDKNRVWSIDTRGTRGSLTKEWPVSLHPFLRGKTVLTVRDSATFEEFAAQEISFSPENVRVFVADDAGVPLSVNKWGRLGKSLDAIGGDIQNAILDRAEEVIADLEDLGLRPFIVGGTLLGAVRDGMLLPHDDDADIAYYSEFDNPVDVAAEGYRVGRELEKRGYKLMRHSATHMQLHFTTGAEAGTETGTETAYYIDVFAAFFTPDGFINQPFHVRDRMLVEELVPFSLVEISGRRFPAPADPETWLTINYDSDWRTPIPGYVLNTPESTNRRFFNWFGSFNHHRHFWNDFFDKNPDGYSDWKAGADWLRKTSFLMFSPQLLELGCGANPISFSFNGVREETIATDFASLPLRLAEQKAGEGQRTAHLNLFRLNTVTAPERLGIPGAYDVVANHLLDQTVREARAGAYQMFYMALLSGGSAAATFFTKPDPDVHPEDPTMWHVPASLIAEEAAKHKMGVIFEAIEAEDPRIQKRKPYAAIFNLDLDVLNMPEEKLTMKERIARFLDNFSLTKSQREIKELRKHIVDLQDELDEYRGLSSRIAQLTDILENRLEDRDKQ